MKKVPNFKIGWPAPATPRALNIKAVYVVSHSWYGQIIDSVCIRQPQPRIAAGARQHAGALCSMYESSYIKNCNSEIELVFFSM